MISSQCAPTDIERRQLDERRGDLTMALTPCSDEARIQARIVSLRLVMPSATGGESTEDKARTLKLYTAALRRFPEWAIGEACARFIDGRAGNGRFAPTPAEIAKECADLVEPHMAEHTRITRLLDAHVERDVSQEERKRVAAGFDKLLNDIKGTNGTTEPAKPKEMDPEATKAAFAEAAAKSNLGAMGLLRKRGESDGAA